MSRFIDGFVAYGCYEAGSYLCEKSDTIRKFVIGEAVEATSWRVMSTPPSKIGWLAFGNPKRGLNFRRPAEFQGAAVISTPADKLLSTRNRDRLRSVMAVAFTVGEITVAGQLQSVNTRDGDLLAAVRYDLEDPNDLNSGGMLVSLGWMDGRSFVGSGGSTHLVDRLFADDFSFANQSTHLQ